MEAYLMCNSSRIKLAIPFFPLLASRVRWAGFPHSQVLPCLMHTFLGFMYSDALFQLHFRFCFLSLPLLILSFCSFEFFCLSWRFSLSFFSVPHCFLSFCSCFRSSTLSLSLSVFFSLPVARSLTFLSASHSRSLSVSLLLGSLYFLSSLLPPSVPSFLSRSLALCLPSRLSCFFRSFFFGVAPAFAFILHAHVCLSLLSLPFFLLSVPSFAFSFFSACSLPFFFQFSCFLLPS